MFKMKQEWLEISQRQRISPFPNSFSMACITKEMKRVIGYAYQEVITLYQENTGYFFIAKHDFQRVGKGILKKIIAEPGIFVKLAKQIQKTGQDLVTFAKGCHHPKKLNQLANKQLAALVKKYEQLYKKVYILYFPAFAQENYFGPALRRYLLAKTKNEDQASYYLNVLTISFSAMVNRRELKAALALAAQIKRRKKWLNYFRLKDFAKIAQLVGKDKKLFQLIKKHENSFFWLTRDYDDPILTFTDIIQRLQKHLLGDPASNLSKLIAEEQKVNSEQKRIVKVLNMDKKTARLFRTMREAIHNKELRKAIVSKSLYYFDPVLLEIGRRAGLTLNQVRHFKSSEIEQALIKGKDFSKILSDRIKSSAWLFKNGQTVVYSGQEAEKYFKRLVKIDHQVNELVGRPAAPGKTSGPVKIVINPDAFGKVKKGDIIVTVQVTPVFSTVIALAAGIVCDGGSGITSHPATLAREAGIPCVVGVKYATKILRDGDVVEVDGTKGVMRVIKRI